METTAKEQEKRFTEEKNLLRKALEAKDEEIQRLMRERAIRELFS